MMSRTRQQYTQKDNETQQQSDNLLDFNGILSERGLLEMAQLAGWERVGNRWHIPIFDIAGQVIATRSKAANKNDAMKYSWVGGKPNNPDVDFYILPNTKDAIYQANGTAYLANGEPALLAYHAAGIHNVIATTLSEVGIPKNLLTMLSNCGISRLLYPVDKDAAGEKSALNWRDALRGTAVDFEAFSWGLDAPDKADANDIWMQVDFDSDAFIAHLNRLSPLDLPLLEPKPQFDNTDFAQTPQGLIDAIISELRNRGFKGGGDWISGKSIFRDEKKPSLSVNIKEGIGHDHATGDDYGHRAVADALGIDWKAYYPKQEQRKKLSKQGLDTLPEYPMSEWASPVELPSYEADLQVDLRYISELDSRYFQHETLRIKSPLASGKTELFKVMIDHWTKENGRAPTVLVQTHSQALVNNLASRLGIHSYQDVPQEGSARQYINMMSQLAITYDSLHLVSGREFDLVFIDEFEQNMAHLSGGTMTGAQARRAFNTLCDILQTAGQVTIADAHLTDGLLSFITRYRDKSGVFSIEDTQRQEWGTITLYKDNAALIDRALSHSQTTDKPIVITTNSRTQTEVLRSLFSEEIGEEHVFVINGWNSGHQTRHAFINDINQQLGSKRVVITSPTLGTGIDIQAPVAAVYGIFSRDTWGCATVTMQQMMRFRNANERHLYVQPIFDGKEETDTFALFNRQLARVRGTASAAQFNSYGIDSDDSTDRSILMIESIQKTARAKQRNNLFDYTVAYAKDEGFTLKYDERENKAMRARLKDARQALKDEAYDKTTSLDPVTSEEYDALLQAGKVDRDVHYQHLRFKIERTAGQEITHELYHLLMTATKRADFNRFLDLHESVDCLQLRDRTQAEYKDLISKRGHYTKVQQLIVEALTSVFGSNWHLKANELTASQINERIANYLNVHSQDIQIYIDKRTDLSVDPVAILRRLLKRVALKLNYRRVRIGGELTYLYSIDREHLNRLSELAITAIAARREKQDSVPKHVTTASDIRVLEQKGVRTSLQQREYDMSAPNQGVQVALSSGERITIPF